MCVICYRLFKCELHMTHSSNIELRRQPQVLFLIMYMVKDMISVFPLCICKFMAQDLLNTPLSLPSISLLEQCTTLELHASNLSVVWGTSIHMFVRQVLLLNDPTSCSESSFFPHVSIASLSTILLFPHHPIIK